MCRKQLLALDHPTRPLDYTLVIGDDMKDSLEYIGNVPAVYFNHDMIYFDPRFTREDIYQIYQCEKHAEADNQRFFIFGGRQYYTSEEIKNMESLNTMILRGRLHKPYWYKLQMSPMHDFNAPCDKEINGSGYVHKTDEINGTSIFNMVDYWYETAYLVTILMKGFVGKDLTLPIIEEFRSCLPREKVNYRYPLSTDFHIPFLGKKKEYKSLSDIMNSGVSFKERIKNNKTFSDAFKELDCKNMVINFHVLDEGFI